jgi:hypothetical protein
MADLAVHARAAALVGRLDARQRRGRCAAQTAIIFLALQHPMLTRSSYPISRRLARLGAVALLCAVPVLAAAQPRLEREGVVLYWGLVPAAVVSQQHALDEMHGGPPIGGGAVNHLVVALFDARTGGRIDNAVVRAQLSEPGIVDGPPKYLTPMPVNGQASYGQLFGMTGNRSYRFRLTVQLPQTPRPIEYSITGVALAQP